MPSRRDLMRGWALSAVVGALLGRSSRTANSSDALDERHWEVNVRERPYFARGDGRHDDTARLEAAFSETPEGGIVVVPPGSYRTTGPVVLDRNVNVSMQGRILADHAGTALLVVGAGRRLNSRTPGRHHLRLAVEYLDKGQGPEGTGVELRNVYHAQVWLDLASGFATNLALTAGSDSGCVYNTIFLGRLHKGRRQIHLRPDEVGRGWVNQNTFIGGRLHLSREPEDRSDYDQIRIDGGQKSNGNLFLNVSVEDPAGGNATVLRCDGVHNTFISGRAEASKRIVFGPRSRRNYLHWGPYITIEDIEDHGVENTIVTSGNGAKFLGGNRRVPVLSLQHSRGDNASSLSILDSSGKEERVSITADGSWRFSKLVRVFFGRFEVPPNDKGRFKEGDFSWSAHLSAGDPLGYVYSAESGGGWLPVAQVGTRTGTEPPGGRLHPKYLGEEYFDASAGIWYKSAGEDADSWVILAGP